MTKRTDTWMPLYVGDYLADTGRLTTEGHGAYLLLLMDYWRNGPPADDDAMLAAIAKLPPARWRKVRASLEPFFTIAAGRWRQKRVDAEMARAGRITGARSEAGKAGASARWARAGGPDGNADDAPMPDAMANAMGNGMANAMANGYQDDRPSPPPPPPRAEPEAAAPHESAGARESRERLAVGARVLAAAGIDPARWVGSFAVVSAWLSAGYDPDLDIVPAVAAVARRPGYTPDKTLNYFTKAIEQHWRDRRIDPAHATPRRAVWAPPGAREGSPQWRYERAIDRWSARGCVGPEPQRADYDVTPATPATPDAGERGDS